MAAFGLEWNRLAAVVTLVELAAPASLGRTALVKCLYFLKTLRDVPLRYHFTLYTYGPFDADVLDDLGYLESIDAVQSDMVSYHGGYGYNLKTGPRAEQIKKRGAEFVNRHHEDCSWVISEFGRRSTLDLEMLGTIVYIDRSLLKRNTVASIEETVVKACEIKPRHDRRNVEAALDLLLSKGLLKAVLHL